MSSELASLTGNKGKQSLVKGPEHRSSGEGSASSSSPAPAGCLPLHPGLTPPCRPSMDSRLGAPPYRLPPSGASPQPSRPPGLDPWLSTRLPGALLGLTCWLERLTELRGRSESSVTGAVRGHSSGTRSERWPGRAGNGAKLLLQAPLSPGVRALPDPEAFQTHPFLNKSLFGSNRRHACQWVRSQRLRIGALGRPHGTGVMRWLTEAELAYSPSGSGDQGRGSDPLLVAGPPGNQPPSSLTWLTNPALVTPFHPYCSEMSGPVD